MTTGDGWYREGEEGTLTWGEGEEGNEAEAMDEDETDRTTCCCCSNPAINRVDIVFCCSASNRSIGPPSHPPPNMSPPTVLWSHSCPTLWLSPPYPPSTANIELDSVAARPEVGSAAPSNRYEKLGDWPRMGSSRRAGMEALAGRRARGAPGWMDGEERARWGVRWWTVGRACWIEGGEGEGAVTQAGAEELHESRGKGGREAETEVGVSKVRG